MGIRGQEKILHDPFVRREVGPRELLTLVLVLDVATIGVRAWTRDCPAYYRGQGAETYKQNISTYVGGLAGRCRRLLVAIDGRRPRAKDEERARRAQVRAECLRLAKEADERGDTVEADAQYRNPGSSVPEHVWNWLVAYCHHAENAGKVQIVGSPGEADSQVAAMLAHNLVHGVVMGDSDGPLGYAAKYTIFIDAKNPFKLWSISGHNILSEQVRIGTSNPPLTLKGLTPEDLTTVSAAVGCDYFGGVHNVGWTQALKMYQAALDGLRDGEAKRLKLKKGELDCTWRPDLPTLREAFLRKLEKADEMRGPRARGNVRAELPVAWDLFTNPAALIPTVRACAAAPNLTARVGLLVRRPLSLLLPARARPLTPPPNAPPSSAWWLLRTALRARCGRCRCTRPSSWARPTTSTS